MPASPRCAVPCHDRELVGRLRASLPPDDRVARLAELFAVLADPTRVRVLLALAASDELCVCDVAHVIDLPMSATSHQLRKLRDAGAVTSRADGRMVYYRLADPLVLSLLSQARDATGRAA
jgi:ArsR family transcriptional regulator, lead/cadmium/zinc/bismuth-responsive transcriptional repressor